MHSRPQVMCVLPGFIMHKLLAYFGMCFKFHKTSLKVSLLYHASHEGMGFVHTSSVTIVMGTKC